MILVGRISVVRQMKSVTWQARVVRGWLIFCMRFWVRQAGGSLLLPVMKLGMYGAMM